MFSSKTKLSKRTPDNGVDRKNFLKLLLDEFFNSKSKDAQYQVLGNLANFAYDPINFEYIRDLGILDAFLAEIFERRDERLTHFAIVGICNLCLDPNNASYIVKNGSIQPIIALLHCQHEETVLNALTTLIYLTTSETRSQIATPNVLKFVEKHEKSSERRLKNLAIIFMELVCGKRDSVAKLISHNVSKTVSDDN